MTNVRYAYGLVDTNVIVHHKSLPSTQLPRRMSVSAITVAELISGVFSAVDAQTVAAREANLALARAAGRAVPFDENAAASFGLLCRAVNDAGRQTRGRILDLMIAATAHANGLTLFTTNPRDFKGIDTLVRVIALTVP